MRSIERKLTKAIDGAETAEDLADDLLDLFDEATTDDAEAAALAIAKRLLNSEDDDASGPEAT